MQSVNFGFLKPYNELLASLAGLAEAVLHVDPGSTLTRLRSFAEELTKTIYEKETLPRLPQASFYDLVKDPVFANCASKALIHQINYLRMQGNETAHGGKGDVRTARQALKIAHQLATYMAVKYYGVSQKDIPHFIDLPDKSDRDVGQHDRVSVYEKELRQKEELLSQAIAELERQRTHNLELLEPPARPDQQKRQHESQQVADSLQWNEAKKSGNVSLQAGREQARLYADGFERMGLQRPVIFYSNGYETFIWDDAQYNTYRPVYGLYSKDSLEYLIYQRNYREKELERFNPELSIADRPYQIEAIKTVAAHFQNQRRHRT